MTKLREVNGILAAAMRREQTVLVSLATRLLQQSTSQLPRVKMFKVLSINCRRAVSLARGPLGTSETRKCKAAGITLSKTSSGKTRLAARHMSGSRRHKEAS